MKQAFYYGLILTLLSSFRIIAQDQDSPFPWPEGKKAALCLSFDDARLSNVDVGLDLFRESGIRVTYYVVPNGVEDRLDKWRQAVLDGHEIGNHTLVHPCSGNFEWSNDKALENYSLASMEQELLAANDQIWELLKVRPKSFAYSCGQTFVGRGKNTRSYVPLVADMFVSGRGWLNEAANDPWFVDLAQLQGVEMDGKDFESQIKPIVDKALSEGKWLVLAGHEIGVEGNQTTRIAMLEDLIEYVRTEHPEIWLAPVGDVADHILQEREKKNRELVKDLMFYCSFDDGVDADLSLGKPTLHTGLNYDLPQQGESGLHVPSIRLQPESGRYGGALKFEKKTKEVVFYNAEKNINYDSHHTTATISFWLSLDPEADLEPGFCDPIQITDSGYNDAAYWVDFSDKNPRKFRMGIFGDLSEWNPENKSPDTDPAFNNRLVVAKDRPFGTGIWTHIVLVVDGLNSDRASARFYVNGKLQGERKIEEKFNWTLSQAQIYLGLNYIGMIDELAIFGKAMTSMDIRTLYNLEMGLSYFLKN